MQRIPLTFSFLLCSTFGCRAAPPRADAQNGFAASAPASSPSDNEIVSNIEEAILKSRTMEPQSGDVRASAVGGVVTLQGHVDSIVAKQRFHDLAQRTAGVKTVIDQLDAPMPNPSATNDAEMTHAIQQKLAARQADDVKVTTVNATVVLEGSVLTRVERAEIEKMAASVPNVMVVDNRLRIRPLAKL
jgi:osmotically-inducible protein OsmY